LDDPLKRDNFKLNELEVYIEKNNPVREVLMFRENFEDTKKEVEEGLRSVMSQYEHILIKSHNSAAQTHAGEIEMSNETKKVIAAYAVKNTIGTNEK
jgi:hypothetical protein